MKTMEERFWDKVIIARKDECWLWSGACFSNGYGSFYFGVVDQGYKYKRAHRVAWEMKYGEIPSGKIILHSCDVATCVNINHLRLGTNADNTMDMLLKGRANCSKGEKHYKTVLTAEDVKHIFELCQSGLSYTEVANKFNVTKNCIGKINRKETWAHTTCKERQK